MRHTLFTIFGLVLLFTALGASSCDDSSGISDNHSAFDEQARTEQNQQRLFQKQPPPQLDWSLERDNLIKRFKLQNDRAISFYMYVFVEGVADPVGYYQINKVSSVDSQLTNTMQVVRTHNGNYGTATLPSPAEDGSYGTNGQGVFGFTPEDVYIEHNMHYIVSSIPLQFAHPVVRLAVVNSDEAKQMLEKSKQAMK
jgi:hypothetical protein